jgi:hypothetical protein
MVRELNQAWDNLLVYFLDSVVVKEQKNFE